jgi:hypothetical protein
VYRGVPRKLCSTVFQIHNAVSYTLFHYRLAGWKVSLVILMQRLWVA